MKCPTHLEFFNDTKYLISGDWMSYSIVRYNGERLRVCKECEKKIEEKLEKRYEE